MNEIRRVCGKRYVCLIICLILLNVLFISADKSDTQVVHTYIDMVNIADNYSMDAASWTEATTSAWREYFEKNKISGSDSDENTAVVKQAREKLMNQAKYIDNYSQMIDEKRQTIVSYTMSGVYDSSSFEYNNLLKTGYDLSHVSDADIRLSNGIWLEKLFENNYIHLLALITCVYTVYMFLAERKNGLYYIVHAARNGRAQLFVKRFSILVIQAVVTNVVLYTVAAVILINRFDGWNGLNDAAASDEYFFLTSGIYTRIEFLGLMIMISVMTTVVLSLILWGVLLCFSNVNIGLFFYCSLCAADVLLYMLLSAKSILRGVKYLNIYYFFFPHKAFEYYNWGYSDKVVSLCSTLIILSILVGLMALAFSAYISMNKYFTGENNAIENAVEYIGTYIRKLLSRVSISWMETYKILVSQGIIAILLILVYIVSGISTSHGVIYDANKSYMLGYFEKAEGLSYGTQLCDIYDEYRSDYEKFLENFDYTIENAGIILTNRENQFKMVEENVNYIKRMNEKGVSAIVINTYEFTDTIGKREWDNQELVAFINVIAAVVISCGFISYEKKYMVYSLVAASKERKSWLARKLAVQGLLCFSFMCITYGIYVKKLCDVYTYTNLTAPLKSIMLFEKYAFNPPIIVYIIVDVMVKYVFLIAIQLAMSFVSIYVKYLYGFAVGLILVLPQLLHLIGFDYLYSLSIVKYISFFELWTDGGNAVKIYLCVLFAMIITGICMFIRLVNVFYNAKRTD